MTAGLVGQDSKLRLRVAVLGAGVCGLTAAYRLGQQGHQVDVYERWPGLGGQAATMPFINGTRVEHYYHYWYTSDRDVVGLWDELGIEEEIGWHPARMGFVVDGRLHPFTTPFDLLRFKPVSLRTRLRMGWAVLDLQRRHREVEPFESITAREWIERRMGRQAWRTVWGPLMRGKFGDRADEISMAWLWSKLMLRRPMEGEEARHELLGYPRGSFEPLWQALQARIEAQGGRVLIDRPAARLSRHVNGAGLLVWHGPPGSFRAGRDPRRFGPALEPERYDAVLAAMPSDIFEQLLDPELADEVGAPYLARLRAIDYHTAVCMLLELDRPLTDYFWLNIADPKITFVGLIEHTNLVGAERYGGSHLVYVGNYVPPYDPLVLMDEDALYRSYEPGLERINPAFSPAWVKRRWLFREPAAQPIVTVGHRDRVPPMCTPAPGLLLANTTQIYPEDRGTNYGVRQGGQAAELLVASAARAREQGVDHVVA
jgi:protoporphyrinogen oxidase